MKTEAVSIILPTYNRGGQIEQAINSVLEQTYRNFELLVIDDGSTDDTEKIVGKISDERLRYIKLPVNKGVATARNIGIENAKFSYIAFEDSDDTWWREKLDMQMKAMQQLPDDVGIVYSKYFYHSYNGMYDGIGPNAVIKDSNKTGKNFSFLLLENMVATPTILARRDVFEKCGQYNENWRCLEDYELILRIAQRYSFYFMDHVLVDVYANQNSVSNNPEEYFKSRCRLFNTYYSKLKEYEIEEYVYEDIFERAKETGYEYILEKYLDRRQG